MHTCTATYRVVLNTCTHTDLLPMVVQACTCRCIPSLIIVPYSVKCTKHHTCLCQSGQIQKIVKCKQSLYIQITYSTQIRYPFHANGLIIYLHVLSQKQFVPSKCILCKSNIYKYALFITQKHQKFKATYLTPKRNIEGNMKFDFSELPQ